MNYVYQVCFRLQFYRGYFIIVYFSHAYLQFVQIKIINMSYISILIHLEELLHNDSEALLALQKFRSDMAYSAPECQHYKFWNGTMASPGICTILQKYASKNVNVHQYFNLVCSHYKKTMRLEHVEA